jgi:hypothetical protein
MKRKRKSHIYIVATYLNPCIRIHVLNIEHMPPNTLLASLDSTLKRRRRGLLAHYCGTNSLAFFTKLANQQYMQSNNPFLSQSFACDPCEEGWVSCSHTHLLVQKAVVMLGMGFCVQDDDPI